MIKIIQFSDFHLENEKLNLQKQNLITALLADLEAFFQEENSFFVFTGDCIDKGGKDFNDPKSAFSSFEKHFIKPILNKFDISKERFFIVPGNHDTFRNKVDKYKEVGLKEELTQFDEINNFILKCKENNQKIPRIKAFKKFEKSFYDGVKDCSLSLLDSNFKFELNGLNVGIACLNTSWRCFNDEDSGFLLIGENQILNSCKHLEDCNVKIALGHHPIEWLLETDRNRVKPILEREFDFYLFGHTHKLEASYKNSFYGKIYYNNACATLGDFNLDGTYVNGYNIIEYKINESIKVIYRKYNREKNKFITDSDAGNEEGYSIISIPNKTKQTENFEVLNIIDSLSKSKIDSLDEHLIIYNTDSDAPCTLKKVFVDPTITNYPNPNAVESDELIKYSVGDVIKNRSNFLIFGTKESGKTILLDRIFIEYLEKSNIDYIIPVLINFKEIGNRQLATVVKEFLNKSTTEVNNLLKRQKVVLLIDDISFDEKFKHIAQKLKNFLKEHKVKTICTSTIINLTQLGYFAVLTH